MTDVFGSRIRKSMLVVMSILASTVVATQVFAETLILQGSSTVNRWIMEQHQTTIESESGHELTVVPNRTLLGLIALMEGRAHIAMISAPLKNEMDALHKAMPGLPYEKMQVHELLTTRAGIGVHASNPIRKASLDQIRQILLGKITNWAELGGKNLPIRIVVVGGGGGVAGSVEVALLGGQRINIPNILYVKTAVQLVQVVEQDPTMIGFGQLSLIKQRGIPEIVTDSPIEQTLSLVTLGDPTPSMTAVIQAARRVARKVEKVM